jgi:hypothetical protein
MIATALAWTSARYALHVCVIFCFQTNCTGVWSVKQ